jgi:hypothetical protein
MSHTRHASLTDRQAGIYDATGGVLVTSHLRDVIAKFRTTYVHAPRASECELCKRIEALIRRHRCAS